MSAKITVCDTVPMSAVHRCDHCGAQAYVAVRLTTSEILLCAHHGTRYWETLLTQAQEIVDHRPYLKKQEEGVLT